ncbi:transcriptional regulator [Stetteria hydrogenophila]
MPCEITAKYIIPSIRALIAKVLVEEYGVPRYRVAKLLNTTPASITNYLEGRRGNKFLEALMENAEVKSIVRRFCEKILSHPEQSSIDMAEYREVVCSICTQINPLARLALGSRPGGHPQLLTGKRKKQLTLANQDGL